MRAPANPPAKPLGRLALVLVALMLATVSMTTPAKADEPSGAADGESAVVADVAGESAGAEGDAAPAADAASPEPAEAPTLAGYLAGGMLRVSADVVLVSGDDKAIEPVVGSFTADGLTYAIVGEGKVALVAVSPRTLAGGLVGGSDVGSDAEDAGEPVALALPEAVSCDGSDYSLTAIGPRALAGCEAGTVALPASVASVDQAAFEGSSVASVEVAEGNPEYSSYDGMLFDAGLTRLLLVPEGKQGAARVPETAQEVDAHALSHSGGVSAFSVDAGCAAFHSENGSLYDSGDNLLWAPPGSEGAASLAAGDDDAGDGASCAAEGLPAASLGEAAASRNKYDLTLNAGGGTIYVTDKALTTLSSPSSSNLTVECGCTSMRVRLLPGCPGAIHFQHGADHSNNQYRLWVRPGYKVTGFRDVANSGDYALTESWLGMAGKARTLEPTWSPQSYTITLDANGGTMTKGTGGSQSAFEEATYAFTYKEGMRVSDIGDAARVARKGYRHLGWSLVVNGLIEGGGGVGSSSVSYQPDALFASSDKVDIAVARGQSVKLMACWRKLVRITWDTQGGSAIAPTDQEMVSPNMTNLAFPADPTRAGYAFAGWYTAATGGAKVEAPYRLPFQDTTYYARWEAVAYRLALDKQGGSGGVEAIWGMLGSAVGFYLDEGCTAPWTKASFTPSREGYVFEGFFTEPGGGGTRFSWADGQVSHTAVDIAPVPGTLYAAWRPETFSLMVACNSEWWYGSADWSWYEVCDQDERTYFDDAIAARYDGAYLWVNTLSRGTFAVGIMNGGAGTDHMLNAVFNEGAGQFVDGDIQLVRGVTTSLWVHRYHDVAWDVGGIGDSIGTTKVDHERSAIAPKPEGAPGWTFAGWSASPGGAVLFGAGSPTPAVVQAVTFYARWEGITYAVALDKQGGSGGSESTTATFGQPAATIVPPARAGYAFLGYFAGDTQLQYIGADGHGVRAWDVACDGLLYAHWEPLVFTITFKMNYSADDETISNAASNMAYYRSGEPTLWSDPGCTVPFESIETLRPSTPGFDCVGFYLDRIGTGKNYVRFEDESFRWEDVLPGGSAEFSADTSLYASWRQITYSVGITCGSDWWYGPGDWSWVENLGRHEFLELDDVTWVNFAGDFLWVGTLSKGEFAIGVQGDDHPLNAVYNNTTGRFEEAGALDLDRTHRTELWAHRYVKVLWDSPGIDAGEAESVVDYGESARAPMLDRGESWRFLGWASSSEEAALFGGGDQTPALIAPETTYHACWEPVVYEVTIDANGGSGGPSKVWEWYGKGFYLGPRPDRGDAPAGRFEPPTLMGHTFTGFFEEAGGSGRMVIPALDVWYDFGAWRSTYFSSSMTIYAGWGVDSYTIDLNAGEGIHTDTSTRWLTVDFGQSVVALSAQGEGWRPCRYGYAFDGYFDEEGARYFDAGGRFVKEGSEGRWDLERNLTLYAHWALITSVEVPIALDSASFELGVPDGTVRVAGTDSDERAPGWLRSSMPVEVAVGAVSCEAALDASGAAPGTPEAFWAEHAAFADLEVGPGEGAGGATGAAGGDGAADGTAGADGSDAEGVGAAGAGHDAAGAGDGPSALAATGALSLRAGSSLAAPDLPPWLAIPAATGAPDGSMASLGELPLLYGLSLERLFADPAGGGAGVDIADLLPQAPGSGFAVPTGLLRVTFTVDATKYA